MENPAKNLMGIKTLKYPITVVLCIIMVGFYYTLVKPPKEEVELTKSKDQLGDVKNMTELPHDDYVIKDPVNENTNLNFTGEKKPELKPESRRDKNLEEYYDENARIRENTLAKKRLVTVQKYREPVDNIPHKNSLVLYRDTTHRNKKNDQIEAFEKRLVGLESQNQAKTNSPDKLPVFNDVPELEAEEKPVSRFYGLNKRKTSTEAYAEMKGNKKLILGQLIENKTVISGSDLKVLVREEFTYNNRVFRTGSVISGKCNITQNRLMIDFNGLIENGVYYTISGNVFDTDANLGLNFYTDENEAAKKSARSSVTSSALSQVNPLLIYNPSGNIAQQAQTQIVGSLINQGLNAGQNLLQSRGLISQVKVKSGQICYLNLK